MSAILYPVASSAEEALAAPKGRAARERDASTVAGGQVRFVSEDAGPDFASREAALDAFQGLLDDDRPGQIWSLPPEDRFCALRERLTAAVPAPVAPSFKDGHRWPAPPAKPPKTVFRLSVSYWQTLADVAQPSPGQARDLRRKSDAATLGAAELRALAHTPMRPVRPQQPLDIGLFETRLPEAPGTIIPDD